MCSTWLQTCCTICVCIQVDAIVQMATIVNIQVDIQVDCTEYYQYTTNTQNCPMCVQCASNVHPSGRYCVLSSVCEEEGVLMASRPHSIHV